MSKHTAHSIVDRFGGFLPLVRLRKVGNRCKHINFKIFYGTKNHKIIISNALVCLPELFELLQFGKDNLNIVHAIFMAKQFIVVVVLLLLLLF